MRNQLTDKRGGSMLKKGQPIESVGLKLDEQFRLVSLWDMLRAYASPFVDLIEKIEIARQIFRDGRADPTLAPCDESVWEFNGREELVALLSEVVNRAKELDMHTTATLCQDMIDRVDMAFSRAELPDRLRTIYLAIKAELKGKKLLYVPIGRVNHYEDKLAEFPQGLWDRYGKANFDFEQAGKCFSCEHWTASVFHTMRAAEAGLEEVELHLQIKVKNRNWGQILKEFQDKVNGMQGDEKTKWSTILTKFRRLKDIWRNATMHLDQSYNEAEAKFAFEIVRELLTAIVVAIPQPII